MQGEVKTLRDEELPLGNQAQQHSYVERQCPRGEPSRTGGPSLAAFM